MSRPPAAPQGPPAPVDLAPVARETPDLQETPQSRGAQEELQAPPLPLGPVVVDASFIIAVLRGEPAATTLAAGGVLGRSVLLSVTLAEVTKVMDRIAAMPADLVTRGLTGVGVRLVDFPAAAAEHIPTLVAIDRAADEHAQRDGHRRAQLSLGDLCVLGHALHTGLPVLTGDRHWVRLRAHGLTAPVHLY